jgi:hypothetical protein
VERALDSKLVTGKRKFFGECGVISNHQASNDYLKKRDADFQDMWTQILDILKMAHALHECVN